MKGRPRQVYMNTEVEKKALKVCEKEEISMSALIRIALEEHIERKEMEDAEGCRRDSIG